VFTDIPQAGHRFAFFDMDKLSFPLIVRNFRPGDRFVPLGLRGSQKVKNFFINRKVPRSQRNKCPILLSQDKIIWIAGYEIDDTVKVESSSRNILKVELLLA
jgi:tRNA(Ile)-lysidine synthase